MKPSNFFAAGELHKIGKNDSINTLIEKDILDSQKLHIEYKTNINAVNDYIYYENKESTYSSEGSPEQSNGIYRMKSDGSDKKQISNDAISEMLLSGDAIYYINKSDKYKLYKINLDGSNKTKLSDDENCYDLSISGNSIYYIKFVSENKPRQIFRFNLDGSNKTQIPTDKLVKFMAVDDNYIYFITKTYNDYRIYKMNLDGTGETKLTQIDNFPCKMWALDGNIYYSYIPISDKPNNCTLYKLSSDGKTTILKDNLYGINNLTVTKDKIYFSQNNDICRMNLDGSNFETLK